MPKRVNFQADEGLRQLRFRLVPKYCSEEQFWQRYFAAVANVKRQVQAEHAWGDFDMLNGDDDTLPGRLYARACQISPGTPHTRSDCYIVGHDRVFVYSAASNQTAPFCGVHVTACDCQWRQQRSVSHDLSAPGIHHQQINECMLAKEPSTVWACLQLGNTSAL